LGDHQSRLQLEDRRCRHQDADHQSRDVNHQGHRGHQGHQDGRQFGVHQLPGRVLGDQVVEEWGDQKHSLDDLAEVELACQMD
jgi:hypothetical protein